MKKMKLLLGLALLIYAVPTYANDDFAPSWRGIPNSVSAVWNLNDPNEFDEPIVTGPDAGSVEVTVAEEQEIVTEACELAGRSGGIGNELIRTLVTNLAAEGEGTLIRIQITSTASELGFSGVESATGVFTDPGFVACQGIEEIELEPEEGETGFILGTVDHLDGFFTIGFEVLLDSPGDCSDIQFFTEEIAEGTCIDEVIIDVHHGPNPGFNAVATVTEAEVSVLETEGASIPTAAMVVALDPAVGDVSGSVLVTLDPMSTGDALINGVAAPVLTFSTGDWETPQTVTITGTDDANFEACIEPFTFQASVTSVTDSEFTGAAQSPLTINVIDYENGCVLVAGEPEIEEIPGGQTAELVYSLNRAPDASVFVAITDGSEDPNMPFFTADPNSIEFTTLNWATPKTVTLTAVQDDEFRGEEAGTGAPTETTAVTTVTTTATFFINNDAEGVNQNAPAPLPVLVSEDECGALEFNQFDFDEDCVVGLLDLSAFVEQWLSSTQPGLFDPEAEE